VDDGRTSLSANFGLVVRRHRQAVGLSQEELAHRAGLHRTYVSLIERGQRTVSIEVLRKLAAALDCTMTDLIRELER
jgi:transcriptional regulator with XRE-family HTH domain